MNAITHHEPSIRIMPQLRAHATARDLIEASGTLNFVMPRSEVAAHPNGLICRVMADSYDLEFGFRFARVYIARNGITVTSAPLLPGRAGEPLHFFLMWSPTEITIVVLDDRYGARVRRHEKLTNSAPPDVGLEEWTQTIHTPAVLPPYSLIKWARAQSITPTREYENGMELADCIVDALLALDDKISAVNMQSSLWDVERRRSQIVSRKPKREVDIHPAIHGLLFDVANAKSLEIAREYPIGSGRLDFLFIGPLRGGGISTVCVEVKHAHSDDLVHGLTEQLPYYMQAKGAAFGMYLVLYFKGPEFNRPDFDSKTDFQIYLDGYRRRAGLRNVRIVVLDLAAATPPSKM